jgi:hypothetical protein
MHVCSSQVRAWELLANVERVLMYMVVSSNNLSTRLYFQLKIINRFVRGYFKMGLLNELQSMVNKREHALVENGS